MAETPIGEHRLASLRHRWEQDPSSRIFVQLAEAHRRRGEVAEALDVLEKGLAYHPRYLSANIVQARCYLEQHQGEKARKVLEAVVVRDPTHLVAGQLLVETHLQLDQRSAALDALERYRLLGAGGEEFDELERRANGLSDTKPSAGAELTEPIPTSSMPTARVSRVDEQPFHDAGSGEALSVGTAGGAPLVELRDHDAAESDPPFDLSMTRTTPLNLPVSPAIRTRGALYRAGTPEPFGAGRGLLSPSPIVGTVFSLAAADSGAASASLHARENVSDFAPRAATSAPPVRPAADRTWKGSSSEFAPRADITSPPGRPDPGVVEEGSQFGESAMAMPDHGTLDLTDHVPIPGPEVALDQVALNREVEDDPLSERDESEVSLQTSEQGDDTSEVAEPTIVVSEAGEEDAVEEPEIVVQREAESDEEEAPGEIQPEPEVETEPEAHGEVDPGGEAPIATTPEVDLDETTADLAREMASEVAGAPEESLEEDVEPEEEDIEEHDINEAVASIIELDVPFVPVPALVEAVESTTAEGGHGYDLAAENDEEAEIEAEATETLASESSPERVTATLGDLYRRQGHLEEAQRVYRQVLEAEPSNADALAGLAALSPQPPADVPSEPILKREVTAQDLLGDEAVHERGLTARKLVLLQQYLTRIQGKGQQDVPREAE
ncbi:MAG: tetratricopeptide repeat protein [Thermoanaerobaculia bacterium]|nr:tetratricopeptide repeat protein [Thermoanaerobaculia bacterium]